jgi:hypothetical protein
MLCFARNRGVCCAVLLFLLRALESKVEKEERKERGSPLHESKDSSTIESEASDPRLLCPPQCGNARRKEITSLQRLFFSSPRMRRGLFEGERETEEGKHGKKGRESLSETTDGFLARNFFLSH